MKHLFCAGLVAGTIICYGMSTRPHMAFGGEWLLAIGIIAIGAWKAKDHA